jgi:hypothetical protein
VALQRKRFCAFKGTVCRHYAYEWFLAWAGETQFCDSVAYSVPILPVPDDRSVWSMEVIAAMWKSKRIPLNNSTPESFCLPKQNSW